MSFTIGIVNKNVTGKVDPALLVPEDGVVYINIDAPSGPCESEGVDTEEDGRFTHGFDVGDYCDAPVEAGNWTVTVEYFLGEGREPLHAESKFEPPIIVVKPVPITIQTDRPVYRLMPDDPRQSVTVTGKVDPSILVPDGLVRIRVYAPDGGRCVNWYVYPDGNDNNTFRFSFEISMDKYGIEDSIGGKCIAGPPGQIGFAPTLLELHTTMTF